MREEADQMAFQEFAFMSEELCADLENDYKFDLLADSLNIHVNISMMEKNCSQNLKVLTGGRMK